MTWWRRRQHGNADGIAEAREALAREKQAGQDAEAKRPEVDDLSRALAWHRRENGFGRLVEDAMHLRRRSS